MVLRLARAKTSFKCNGTSKETNFSDNLFSKNNLDHNNFTNSIDGATALKLDESYEIKDAEEQNALINSYESEEEDSIAKNISSNISPAETIPEVSIESASYMKL